MRFTTAYIGELTKIRTGKLDANAADPDGVYPFFTCAKEPLTINKFAYDCDAILVAGNGDLNVKHYKGKFEAYQRTYIIEVVDESQLDSRYLYFFMSKYVDKLRELSIGGVIKYIKLGMLTDAEIPLPPLPEQKRIAAILDKADAIRRKRQQAIKLADNFLRATFLDMFGDPVTNPKGWEVKPIEKLLANKPNAARTGPFGSQLKHSEFTTEGIPVLGIDNIVTNSFRWTTDRCLPEEKYAKFKRYRVFPDDIIITIMGTTGRVAIAPENLPECMSTKHLCVLTLNKKIIDPVFLWAALLFDKTSRRQAKKFSGGAIMEGWNMGIIKSISVRVPPLTNQYVFRKIVMQTEKLKAKLLAWEKNGPTLLFNSLTQRAFRGEL